MHSNMQPYKVARIRRTSAIDTMMIKNDEQTLIYVSDDGQKKIVTIRNSEFSKFWLTMCVVCCHENIIKD